MACLAARPAVRACVHWCTQGSSRNIPGVTGSAACMAGRRHLSVGSAAREPEEAVNAPPPPSTLGPRLPPVHRMSKADQDFMRLALPKSTTQQLVTGGHMDVLERSATQGVVNTLLDSGADGICPRVSLVGPRGVGKSVGLASIARECRSNGWVVAYVPDASEWCEGIQSIEVSKRDPSRLDQYAASARWLSLFMAHNGDTLATIPVAGTYEWDTPLNHDGLDNLEALARFGVGALDENGEGDPTIATDVVGVVLKELRREDLGRHVLVAVDVYNAWLRDVFPLWKDFDSKVVTRDRASLIQHFLRITEATDERPFAQGGVVVAESDKGGTVALQDLTGFAATEMTPYSREEIHALLKHFSELGFVPHELTGTQRDVLQLIISNNPRQFRKHVSAL
eukprot:m.181210 g.181210  ORF g.181210 m.181210 type:complete len:396 (+) comp15191_c0_seq1:124-1311(+)